MKTLFALLLALATLPVAGQTFTFNTAAPIPDTVRNLCFPLAVQGVQSPTSRAYGLTGVCLNITHTYDSDLEVWLTAPTGERVPLFSGVGGAGHNFTSTCLAMDARLVLVNDTAPFSNVYQPEGDLNLLNDSLNPNGVWRLCVSDHKAGDFGILNSYALTFGAVTAVERPMAPALPRLSVSPNPALGGIIRVQLQKPSMGLAYLALTDLAGRAVGQWPVPDGPGGASDEVLAPGLKAGVYLLRLGTEVGNAVARVVVE